MSVKTSLSAMMFLEYAIWGSWAPVLSSYLINTLHFSGTQVGLIYSLLPLATIIAPFIGGQLADRYFPTEKVIAWLQIIGGIILLFGARLTSFESLAWLMLIYCLIFAPTLALTNSIAFANLKDSEKDFGKIRVWGTIGWIAAGWGLTGWRLLGERAPGLAIKGDTLFLAGIFSIIMGLQAFSLPHTPPKKEAGHPYAFLEALKMLKDRDFLIFSIIAFIVATELQFYYVLTAPFLTSPVIGLTEAQTPLVMTIAQFAEMFVMGLLLPYFLPKYGIKKTMIIGVLAWPIRYIIFMVGHPAWLVIASLALHGFCYVFFFTASFIYVDMIAPKDIRASAQSLISVIILGLGNFVGSLFSGWIEKIFTTPAGTNWFNVFMIPTIITIVCAIVFVFTFREKKVVENSTVTG
ncbi:MAG TPA: MFS transporter [Candidatus Saccharicenans sp.]|jgi:nucleoside transporter|nr:MFS transporter [Candidatus Saccharicenans sp.]HOT68253.1 MFS transporter [Candidatus Saccharicenans sp.]HPU93928.1 MFS transporter [Candidatus Saccharicenans sp.]HQE64922.1 MFS transporter [Candidatus Saccharicenans sp.]HQH60283.1 MFS transporter [Candidatus Saccharicenans sp.]